MKMELQTVKQREDFVIPVSEVIDTRNTLSTNSSFIEANTEVVSVEHLKKDCIIPVFSKDNESTISHYQFIQSMAEAIGRNFSQEPWSREVRVSHQVKGRIPSAVGKPIKELKEEEKTIYYERMAFMYELPKIQTELAGNRLNLTIGGVRSYSQENLYSKKSPERFKIFIGFKNRVCTNLCVSTDGVLLDLRVSSAGELTERMDQLISNYNAEKHLESLKQLLSYSLTEREFAQFVGKARIYQYLTRGEKEGIPTLTLNDGQISHIAKMYIQDAHFSREADGTISLWKLYNLLTGATKSSYIDTFLERNTNAFEFISTMADTLANQKVSWYLE